MLKLKHYLKPFLGIMILEFVLLFGQAMVELNLPKFMSEIVNTGLQQWGIESSAPEIIDENSYNSFKDALGAEFEIFENSYTALDNANYKYDYFINKYPNAKSSNTLVLTNNANASQIESLVSRTVYGLSLLDSSDVSGDEYVAKVKELGESDEDASHLMGIQYTKNIYENLGADINAMQMTSILKIGFSMLLLSLIGAMFAIGVGFLASRIGAGVAQNLRRDVFTHVTSFTGTEFDKFSTASLITRTTNDISQIQQFVTMGLRMVCFAPVMGIGGLVMAVTTAPSMTWVLGLGIAVVLTMILMLFKLALPKFKIVQSLVDKLNLVTRENLTGMMVIRAFATQDYEEKRFDNANKELTSTNLFVNRAIGFLMPGMTFVMNGLMLLIVWVGAKEISNSQILVGDMMAFMQYAMEVIMSFLMVSMMFVFIPRASVAAIRIHEVLTTHSSIEDKKETTSFKESPKGLLEFKNVNFRYHGAEEDVLENINFTAKPGETTAFIGSTGSGKSTLINLIPRFYDVTAGEITLDGIDIRDLKQHELREYIGLVPQKGVLFSGDINSNLKFGDENASEKDLEKASEIAQAIDFIKAKDDGFDSEISQGGTNVSGGQRQRLAIARALVKKAPINIFDDSFSALDFKTDLALRKSLAENTENATTLIVAQRISTIMHAEQIIVLDDGKIMGKGTHKELLENCETYREIALSQLSKEELGI